jgi:uncharacterized membrane-anchored protein
MLLAAGIAFADDTQVGGRRSPSPEEISAAYGARVLQVMDGARYREGHQELPGGIAHLDLPEGYRYLGPEDARKVIVDLWGNPPAAAGPSLLGVIIPAGEHLASPTSWTVVLSYDEVGHVSDSDAGRIDFDGLMTRLQVAGAESNKARKASGFDTMDLAGWAVAPRYDREKRALYWARRFTVTRQPEDTLNYDVRVLGRRGVLSLNAIAGMKRVTDIEAASPTLISMVRFNRGHGYGDFNPGIDRHAGLALAGLVAGAPPDTPIQSSAPLAMPRFWIHLIPVALILLLLFSFKRHPSVPSTSTSAPEPQA